MKKALYLQRSKSKSVTMTPPECGFFCGHNILKLELSDSKGRGSSNARKVSLFEP